MREYWIAACSGKKMEVKRGETITVIDLNGGQVVDFFAETAENPEEFLSTGVTMDCNESIKLHPGDTIYTNLYRPMLKILSDDVGEHDLLHPCCRKEMYDFFTATEKDIPTAWTTSTVLWAKNAPSSRRSTCLCIRRSIPTAAFR